MNIQLLTVNSIKLKKPINLIISLISRTSNYQTYVELYNNIQNKINDIDVLFQEINQKKMLEKKILKQFLID